MIGYRFLFPADAEMIEAALFYNGASSGLGDDFLDDVQYAMLGCVNIRRLGKSRCPVNSDVGCSPLPCAQYL